MTHVRHLLARQPAVNPFEQQRAEMESTEIHPTLVGSSCQMDSVAEALHQGIKLQQESSSAEHAFIGLTRVVGAAWGCRGDSGEGG